MIILFSAIVHRAMAVGGAIAAGLVLPNLLIALEKPLNKYLGKLDERERRREKKRLICYMKSRGLISGDYKHGVIISQRGLERLEKMDLEGLAIDIPSV